MEKFLPITIQEGLNEFKIYKIPIIKKNIIKPWVEPEYMLVDIQMASKDLIRDFELEIDWEAEFLRIGVYNTDFTLQEKVTFDLKDWTIKQEIKNLLGIKGRFEPLITFKEIQEELLNYFKNQKISKDIFLYHPFLLFSNPVILVSPMGMGKTLFSLWLSFKVTNGINLVNWEEENPQIEDNEFKKGKVLYLCFEGNEGEINEKKEQIKKGLSVEASLCGVKEIQDFYIEFLEPLSKRIARKKLRHLLSIIQPQLVVFDSITSALLGFPELKQSEFIFDYIATNLSSRGIASLLVMHPAKEDLRDERLLPKGSILYMTHPRIVWGLTQISEFPNGFQIAIKPLKENLGLKRNCYIFNVSFNQKIDEEKGIVNWIDIKLIKKVDELKESKEVKEKCLEYLKTHESATVEEISNFYQLNYDSVKKTLLRLTQSGEVIRISRGKYALKKEETFKIEGNDEKIPF